MDWLYVHFPHLYGESWISDFHARQPIALVAENQQAVEDLNTAANSRGVDVGMALNTAFCLCPTLRVVTQTPHQQQQALEKVALFACHYSAWVSVDAPKGLYLEIASMQKLFGEAKWLQRRLQNVLKQHGYSAVIAAAPQAQAARLLAKAEQAHCYDQQRLLKHLVDIPIAALDIDPKIEVRLMKLGLRTVHDAVQLPSGDLSYRIDAALSLYLDRVVGRRAWLPTPFTLPERFRWNLDLEQEFESLEPLRFFLAKGVQKFCVFLQKRSLAARVLQLILRHRQQVPTVVNIKLASIDNRVDSWQYMLNACINRLTLKAPVTGLGLTATWFETLSDQTLFLFKSVSHECDRKKTLLLNRLSARLGIDALHFLNITNDPRPEKQTQLTNQPGSQLPINKPQSSAPLCLSLQPQPVLQERYCLCRGPLRFATGWWDRATVYRDYYVASDKHLSTQWLFLDAAGQWYRHGWFI